MTSSRLAFESERARHPELRGREDVLALMEDWLSGSADRGWLLITGSPGAGKSAVLSHFIAAREKLGQPVPHHFLRRGVADWDQPYAIQSSLVSQIETLFPSSSNPDARPERRLVELLLRISNRQLIPSHQRLLLIVDGLNEAVAEGSDNPLPRFLPQALPPGVFIVCSIRSGHPYLSFFAERSFRCIDLDRGVDGKHRASQALWAYNGPRLGLPAEYIKTAVRCAEGNPLHALMLAGHLARLSPAERAARISEPVPYGLWGMLEYLSQPLWEEHQLEPTPAAEPPARTALGLLCAARAALPLELLGSILGTSFAPATADGHSDFLRIAAPFLQSEPTPLGEGYRLGHDCFRELVVARLGAQEMRRLHRKLAQSLACWPLAPAQSDSEAEFYRGYALRYAIHHRVEAGDWSGVEQVCSDVDYLIAKCREAGTLALENDFAMASARCPDPVRQKEWRDLQRAVREETHWLRRDPAALPSLLYNRLRCFGWPGARISRALSMPQGVPQLRLQRGVGGYERTLIGHASSVYGCAVTSDGKRLISASWDKTLKVWDLASGHQLLTLKGHTAEVTACVLLPDEQHVLSASADMTLRLWDLQSGRELQTLRSHTGEITCLAVFPDGRRAVSGARDKTLKIWDLGTGQVISTLKGHLSWVAACAVLGGGDRIVSGAWDKTIKIWDVEAERELLTLNGHAAGVRSLAVLPDGRRLISGAEDHTLKLWDLTAGQELVVYQGHTAGVTSCILLPDGRRMVSAAKDKTLRVWDLHSGQALATLQGHSAWVTACAALPDGRQVASGSDDYSIKIWDLTAGQELATLQGHSAAVSSCAMVRGRQRVLTGSADRTLKLWDINAGSAFLTLTGHSDLVTSCAVAPDGLRALSGSWDKTLRLWDLRTGELVRTLAGHSWFVTACAFLPDDKRAVSGSWDKTLRIWDLRTGAELQVLEGHTAQITCVAAVPGSERVISGARDSTLRVWDLQTGQELVTLRGHIDFVTACVVLPDGRRVLSGSGDRTLKVWDLNTGEELMTLPGHAAQVSACAVTADGRRAVSASEDHTVKVWDLQSGRCIDTVYGVAPYDCVCVDEERICAGDRVGNVWMLVSPAVQDEPLSMEAPSLRALSQLLDAVLREPSDLDAFCQHHFPLIHKQFSTEMTREHRISALLSADPTEVLTCLRQSYPESFTQHAHLLTLSAD